jgi:hypothetical protein
MEPASYGIISAQTRPKWLGSASSPPHCEYSRSLSNKTGLARNNVATNLVNKNAQPAGCVASGRAAGCRLFRDTLNQVVTGCWLAGTAHPLHARGIDITWPGTFAASNYCKPTSTRSWPVRSCAPAESRHYTPERVTGRQGSVSPNRKPSAAARASSRRVIPRCRGATPTTARLHGEAATKGSSKKVPRPSGPEAALFDGFGKDGAGARTGPRPEEKNFAIARSTWCRVGRGLARTRRWDLPTWFPMSEMPPQAIARKGPARETRARAFFLFWKPLTL